MAGLTETFDQFLLRFARRAIVRLIQEEGGADGLLEQIRMAARFRQAVDEVIRNLVVTGSARRAESLLAGVIGLEHERPTWKEIGEALGVSAQAAHHKYGRSPGSAPRAEADRPRRDY
jgi:hypothetical protein